MEESTADISDQGTFVSIDNFITTPSRLNVPSPTASPPPQTVLQPQLQTPSSSAIEPHFMWNLFREEPGSNANDNQLYVHIEDSSDNPPPANSDRDDTDTEQSQNPHQGQRSTTSTPISLNDLPGILQQDETLSDVDDMCLNLGTEATRREHADTSDGWIDKAKSDQGEDPSRRLQPSSRNTSVDDVNNNSTAGPSLRDAHPSNPTKSPTQYIARPSSGSHPRDAETPEQLELADSFEHTLDVPFVDDVMRHLSIPNQDRLREGTEGITSCQVPNPFAELESGENLDNNVTLYSRDGPVKSEELLLIQQIGPCSTSVEAKLMSKLFATIVFQRNQISDLEDTALVMSDGALDSAAQKFTECERRRSFAMNALVQELDVERTRSNDMEAKNQELRDRLEFAEDRLAEVEEFGRNMNPAFSLEQGVKEALTGLLEEENPRRESAEEVVDRNEEMQALSSRLLHLDASLSESSKRSNELQAENVMLKTKLVALEEGLDDSNVELSPEIQKKLSPIRDAVAEERDELVSTCKQQEKQIEALREYIEGSDQEKKRVSDAMLSLNLDMEIARAKIDTLQKQRDSAEREWRAIEKLRSSDRKTYHEMCSELSHNIVAAVNDLNGSESKVNLLVQEVEDRESVISSLRANINELDEQLNALTDAAISSVNKSKRGTEDEREQVSVVFDTVVANLRGELERSQALLIEKTQEISEHKKRVAVQEEVAQSLRRERDRYLSIAEARRMSNSPSRRGNHNLDSEDSQNNFLQRLSERLGYPSEKGNEVLGKLVNRVEELLKERAEFEKSAVRLRNEVLERERTLHVVRSEMQAENSTLKAELQHIENLKKRALERCKFAEDKVLELLGDKDLSKADSLGDVTITSLGTRRQSGLSDLDNFSRRDSMISTLGADNTIQWNDPLVDAAIQSLTNLTEMKERISARYRALRERLDRMIRRGEVDASGVDAKALMIESKEIQDDLSGVLNMQQNIIDTLRPRASAAGTVDDADADNTLPYVGNSDILDGSEQDAVGQARRIRDGKHLLANTGGNELQEATGFLRDQLKQTRDLYNEKSRANAQLCGAIAELKHELQHVTSEKKSAEEFLTQVTQNHTSFITRLGLITGTEASMVAIEDFLQSAIQDRSRLTDVCSAKDLQAQSLSARLGKLCAQKHILSHMIFIYQSRYHLDLLMPSSEEKGSAARRFRTRVFALLATIKMRKLASSSEQVVSMEEIDISGNYDLPLYAPIGRHRTDGPSLVNATVAIAAVPRLEGALMDRDRQISELRSAVAALDNTGLPALPEDVRNSMHTSFAYDEDMLARKQDLSRRLRLAVKEKGEVEDRYAREKETRIALEAKLSRYSERLATAKKRLGKMNSQAESKERTYKAAIKYLKEKADKAVASDTSIDENTDPWSSPAQQTPKESVEKNQEQIANAKSLSILQAQLKRAESDLSKTERGSGEHEEVSKYIQGLHKAVQRLRQTRRAAPQAPTMVNSNITA